MHSPFASAFRSVYTNLLREQESASGSASDSSIWQTLKADSEVSGFLSVNAGNFGRLEVSIDPIASGEDGFVSVARRPASDQHEFVVKQSFSPALRGVSSINRKHDPLLGEYAFAAALQGLDLVPEIHWISSRSPSPRKFSRTIVQHRIGNTLDAYIEQISEEMEASEFSKTILNLGLRSLSVLQRLHECSVVHGDVDFCNIAFATDDVDGPLMLIDFEKAAFNSPLQDEAMAEFHKAERVNGRLRSVATDVCVLLEDMALAIESHGPQKEEFNLEFDDTDEDSVTGKIYRLVDIAESMTHEPTFNYDVIRVGLENIHSSIDESDDDDVENDFDDDSLDSDDGEADSDDGSVRTG